MAVALGKVLHMESSNACKLNAIGRARRGFHSEPRSRPSPLAQTCSTFCLWCGGATSTAVCLAANGVALATESVQHTPIAPLRFQTRGNIGRDEHWSGPGSPAAQPEVKPTVVQRVRSLCAPCYRISTTGLPFGSSCRVQSFVGEGWRAPARTREAKMPNCILMAVSCPSAWLRTRE